MAGEQSLTREYGRVFSLVSDKAEGLIADIASAKTAFLFHLKNMGAYVPHVGAPHIRHTVLKALPAVQGYTDLDVLSFVRGEPFTTAIFNWKQLAVPVQVSGRDMLQTDGAEGITDLLEGMILSSAIALRDGLGGSTTGIFSDANETELRKVSGLQNHLSSSTTAGTVGGLNRAVLTNWRHLSGNVNNDFSANGIDVFRTLYRQTSRFDQNVDTIVLNGATMDNHEKALTSTVVMNQPQPEVASQYMLDAGFWNVRYKGAVMFSDDGVPANRGYFLNVRDTLRLAYHEKRNAEIGDFVKSVGYDDLGAHIYWAGNLVIFDLARNGVVLNCDTY